jgi:hypothetical protein
VIATLFIYYMAPRYYAVFVPTFSIWGAAGLGQLALWARETGREIGLPPSFRAPAAWAACGVVLAGGFALSALPAYSDLSWSRGERALQTAGEALRAASDGPIRVAGVDPIISFHSGATHYWLPVSDEQTALAYIAAKSIDYVVVRGRDAGSRSYINAWIAEGVPGMTPVQSFVTDVGETITIYDADG